MLPWCSERPQNTRYSPRRKGKQITNTMLHLFFCYHTGELSFFFGGGGGGGGGSFLLGRNFGVISPIMRGEFCKRDEYCGRSLASYSKQRHSKNVLGLRTSSQFELRLYGVTHTISRSFKTQLNTHVY